MKFPYGVMMRPLSAIAIIAATLLVCACENQEQAATEPVRYEIDELTGESSAIRDKPSLCEILRESNRVGVFTVEEMYSQLDPIEPGSSELIAVTFIELSTEEMWVGADTDEVVVRTQGGEVRRKYQGDWTEWKVATDVSLARGEHIVYFEVESDMSSAFGYPDIWDFTVFRDQGSGFASADLFVQNPISRAELKTLVTDIAEAPAGEPCPPEAIPPEGQRTPPPGFDAGADIDPGGQPNAG